MKQLQGFVRRAAALVLAAVLCLCAPAALAADDAAVSGGAVTMGGANTTLIPAEEENCLSWLFGSGDTITLPYLNIRGQGLKKNVTLNLVDCLVGITYNELGSIGSCQRQCGPAGLEGTGRGGPLLSGISQAVRFFGQCIGLHPGGSDPLRCPGSHPQGGGAGEG